MSIQPAFRLHACKAAIDAAAAIRMIHPGVRKCLRIMPRKVAKYCWELLLETIITNYYYKLLLETHAVYSLLFWFSRCIQLPTHNPP
jgi:hypothetical protein